MGPRIPELFARATSNVLVAGYSFDHGEDVFAPLHNLMATRGVTRDLFVDIDQMLARLRAAAERFTEVTLHAKCVVIDHELPLITSANFTNPGQARNR